MKLIRYIFQCYINNPCFDWQLSLISLDKPSTFPQGCAECKEVYWQELVRNNGRDKIIPRLPIKMQKIVDWILGWCVTIGKMPLYTSEGAVPLPQ